MKRSIEFDLETRSPNAIRFASKRGQRAHDAWVKAQRKAVRDVLAARFGSIAPGPFVRSESAFACGGGWTVPNRIEVRFTRIAKGSLDPDENLPMAFKHVKDEIAAWCNVPNDRDPIFAWSYRQEPALAHVLRARIEITDLAPGEPRVVVLAETGSAGRAAKSRIRRQVKAAAKGTAMRDVNRTANHEAAGALRVNGKATTTGARARAEAAFAKATGKPTAHDLRDAAEGALARHATRAAAQAECDRANEPVESLRNRPEGDLTSLRPASIATARSNGSGHETVEQVARRIETANDREGMRAVARSVTCPLEDTTASGIPYRPCAAAPGRGCVNDRTEYPIEYGVHVARARAAGLPPYPTVAQLDAGVRPVKVETVCPALCRLGRPRDEAPLTAGPLVCATCGGSGKVTAWTWSLPVSPPQVRGQKAKTRPDGDPGEERHARDVAPCVNCGAAIGEPCTALPSESTPGGIRRVFGVHPSRAYAAGLHVDVPPRTPATGPRKLASKVSLPSWLALPWSEHPCGSCGGTGDPNAGPDGMGPASSQRCPTCGGTGRTKPFTRYPALDGPDPPAVVRMGVPAEHVARYTQAVTMTRRPEPFTLRGARVWLYETTGGR